MTSETKKIVFKGIEKKEQILFKSFLNLAKNDLVFDVEVIQDADASIADADIVIADIAFDLSQDAASMAGIPVLKIGDDEAQDQTDYIRRPVQWSDFKDGLASLKFDGASAALEEDRVLPTKIALEIGDEDSEDYDEDEEVSRSFSDASDYNFSLDKMSIDYHSFTNSDYQKVVDDVKGYNEEEPEMPKAVMLVTDDESAHTNSVLVIETNSLDAWDMNDSEFDDVRTQTVESASQLELPELAAKERKEVQSKIEAGESVSAGDELWMREQEVIAGAQTLFVVKPKERKVYSSREPGKWIQALRTKELTSVDIKSDWNPTEEMKVYPLERLIWVNALVGRIEKLDGDAIDSQEFMLSAWPHFELLELDNSLLKITTMLFVGAESAYSLMQKTGEGRAVVYGMLNACNELGLLVSPDQIEQKTYEVPAQEEGMFGKIKDVFR